MKYEATVGYDIGLDEMVVDKVQVFDTQEQAQQWVNEILTDGTDGPDMGRIEPI